MIEFKNVTKIYDQSFPALEDLNLQIADGEFVFVVGPSESGKSSIFRLLTRTEKPTSGTITVGDLDIGKMKRKKVPYYRRKLGIVFQDPRLFPEQTVFDNIALALRVTGAHRADVRTRSHTALKMVELGDVAKKTPAQLSAFDQQRVALARALAGGAGIIIADEPTGNLNPIQAKEFIELLMRIHSRFQKTVLVFTNGKEFAEEFGQRIVFLSSGVVEEDRPATMPLISEPEEELPSDEFVRSYETSSDSIGIDQSTIIFTAVDAQPPMSAKEDTLQFDAVKIEEDDVKPFVPSKPALEDTVQFKAVLPEADDTVEFNAIALEDEEASMEDTLVNLPIVTVSDTEETGEDESESAVEAMASAEPPSVEPADVPTVNEDDGASQQHTITFDALPIQDEVLLGTVLEMLEHAEIRPVQDSDEPVIHHRVFNDLQVDADWSDADRSAENANDPSTLADGNAEEGEQ